MIFFFVELYIINFVQDANDYSKNLVKEMIWSYLQITNNLKLTKVNIIQGTFLQFNALHCSLAIFKRVKSIFKS